MIRKTLLFKELREMRWKLTVGMLMLFVTGVSYPFMHEWLVGYMSSSLPVELLGRLGLTPESIQALNDFTFATFGNWNAKNLQQIGTILAILLGMGLLAGEYEHDTMSFLLSSGLGRRTVFWSKAVAGMTGLAILVWIPTLAIFPASALAGQQMQHYRILGATLVTFAGLAAFFALSILLSAVIKDGLKAGLAAGGIALGLGLLGVVPDISDYLPFRQMAAMPYFLGVASFPWLTMAIFAALTTLLLVLAYRTYARDDI